MRMVYMFLISIIVLLLQLSLPISHEPQFVYDMHDYVIHIFILLPLSLEYDLFLVVIN